MRYLGRQEEFHFYHFNCSLQTTIATISFIPQKYGEKPRQGNHAQQTKMTQLSVQIGQILFQQVFKYSFEKGKYSTGK